MSSVILVVTALACLAIAEAIYYAVRYAGESKRNDLRRRLRSVGTDAGANLLRERRVARNPELERFLQFFPFTEPLERLLSQTSLTWTVASALGIGILAAVVLGGVSGAVFHGSVITWFAVPAGLALPVLIAIISRDRRSEQLSSQLPEALDMMVRSLRAGHGLNSAIKLVATEMPVPVAEEFARCFEEHNLGIDFRTAIGQMTTRVPGNLDLKIFAVSVVLQHETGGNLIEILEQIGHTIRERYKFYGKLAALTAEGRVSGIILGSMPFFTVVMISLGNPKYLGVLITDKIGHFFIAGALLLWGVGVAWLARLTRVDY